MWNNGLEKEEEKERERERANSQMHTHARARGIVQGRSNFKRTLDPLQTVRMTGWSEKEREGGGEEEKGGGGTN